MKKAKLVKEVQELQKLGLCKKLNLIEEITSGEHDETINSLEGISVREATDLIIHLGTNKQRSQKEI